MMGAVHYPYRFPVGSLLQHRAIPYQNRFCLNFSSTNWVRHIFFLSLDRESEIVEIDNRQLGSPFP